jgi:hypothetical protein
MSSTFVRAPSLTKNVAHEARFASHSLGESVTIRVVVQADNPLGSHLQTRLNAAIATILLGVEPHGFSREGYSDSDAGPLTITPKPQPPPPPPPTAKAAEITRPVTPESPVQTPRRKAVDRARD